MDVIFRRNARFYRRQQLCESCFLITVLVSFSGSKYSLLIVIFLLFKTSSILLFIGSFVLRYGV